MRQKLEPGGFLDFLTNEELKSTMGHSLDATIAKWYRGVDYLSFINLVPAPAIGPFTIPQTAESGYCWSVKLVSFQLSAGATGVSLYVGSSNSPPPVAVGTVGTNNEVVFTFSANQLVMKDSQNLTVQAYGGGVQVLGWHLRVKQVPVEMQGKL
jgi:hypothetical protein